jgi:hypothetical protein
MPPWQFSVLLGPFDYAGNDNVSLVHQVKGKIMTGSHEDYAGDRYCMHKNFLGSIFLPPFDSTKDSTGMFPVYKMNGIHRRERYPQWSTASFDVSHFLSNREPSFSQQFSFDMRVDPKHPVRNEGYGRFKIRGKLVGNRFLTGYAIDMFTCNRYGQFIRGTSSYIVEGVFGSKYNYCTYGSKSASGLSSWDNFDLAEPGDLTLSPPTQYSAQFRPTFTKAHELNHIGLVDQKTLLDNFYPDLVYKDPDDFGDLAQDCVEQLKYVAVNTLAFVNELRDVANLLPKIGSLKNPKTWGGLVLSYKYGARLTYADTVALTQGIHDAKEATRLPREKSVITGRFQGSTMGAINVNQSSHYKVLADTFPNDAMELIRSMDSWGLWPSTLRMWDMIPLSFVIDWQLNVSSVLGRIDTYTMAQYYNVLAVCRSRKVICDVPCFVAFPWLQGIGSFQEVYYLRTTQKHLDLPRFRMDSAGQLKNYVELFSLIVTRS